MISLYKPNNMLSPLSIQCIYMYLRCMHDYQKYDIFVCCQILSTLYAHMNDLVVVEAYHKKPWLRQPDSWTLWPAGTWRQDKQ